LPPSDVVGYSRSMEADEVDTAICTRTSKDMLTQKRRIFNDFVNCKVFVDKVTTSPCRLSVNHSPCIRAVMQASGVVL
jgi:hypothetical protein